MKELAQIQTTLISNSEKIPSSLSNWRGFLCYNKLKKEVNRWTQKQ